MCVFTLEGWLIDDSQASRARLLIVCDASMSQLPWLISRPRDARETPDMQISARIFTDSGRAKASIIIAQRAVVSLTPSGY